MDNLYSERGYAKGIDETRHILEMDRRRTRCRIDELESMTKRLRQEIAELRREINAKTETP